ncbi:MAG: isopenicillin N synthase family oxygenase [Sphingomonadaceae bacterium]|nr:isopenicillin N synthase family oxygenase [Sphingomonadaceae bacterium]
MSAAAGAVRVAIERLPVVDIAAWRGGDPAARRAVAAKVFAACRDVGFLYIAGHGIPAATIDSAFAAARAFFALPEAEKLAVHYELGGRRRGYLPLLAESSDPAAKGDLKEAFDLGYDAPGRPPWPGIEGDAIRNLWPDRPAGFRQAVAGYFAAGRALAVEVFAMLAHGLGLGDDWFAGKVDKPVATMRLLHYPSQPVPSSTEVLGIGAHCDYECLTILAQDTIGGLQVRGFDGGWIAAPPIPGTFVVNVGEMLARWSGGRLIATEHRVVNTSGRDRLSIPLFFATNPDVMIHPIGAEGSASMEPPIQAGRYLAQRLDEVYG